MEIGAIILDPTLTSDRTADHKKRLSRAKMYQEIPASAMEKTPLVKKALSSATGGATNTKLEWWERRYNAHYAQPTGIYASDGTTVGAAITTQDVNAAGYIAVKMAEKDAKTFTPMERRTILRNNGYEVNADVTSNIVFNGANSYVHLRLLEDDPQGGVSSNAASPLLNSAVANTVLVMGTTAMPELSGLPEGHYEEGVSKFNYHQIMMQSFAISGSEASDENVYNIDTYADGVDQMMNRFHEGLERALRYGIRVDGTGSTAVTSYGAAKTGKRYQTGGLKYFLGGSDGDTTNSQLYDIRRMSSHGQATFTSSLAWNTGAWPFLQNACMLLGKYSGAEKDVYLGCDAYLAILDALSTIGQVTIGSDAKDAWGFSITKIKGLNCVLNLHQDVMFSTTPGMTRRMMVVEPGLIGVSTKKGRDITVIKSQQLKELPKNNPNGWAWVDGIKEGVFADIAFEFRNLKAMAMYDGIGLAFNQ